MKQVAVKCGLCVDRLAEGKGAACMSMCPTGCINPGGEKALRRYSRKMRDHTALPLACEGLKNLYFQLL
ncbi:hypothetical protein ACFL2O_03475 [Thermodesulfobacteriota bacterium]